MKRFYLVCGFKVFVVFPVIVFLGFFSEGTAWPNSAAVKKNEPTPVVSAVEVNIVNAPDNEEIYLHMAERLIRLKPGRPLSAAKIEASVDALRLSRRFVNIHIDTKSTTQGEIVSFTLTPFRFIKDIVISGSYPFFEKDILNRMTIYAGEVLQPEDLPKQSRYIEAFYRKEGYVAPQVEVLAKNGSDSKSATIHVLIEKGSCYIPGKLTFVGNESIGVTWLKPRMKSWRVGLLMGAMRFTEERLKKDIEKLIEYYHGKGFAEVEINYDLDRKSDFPEVDVKLNISEGPRYEIDFEGNRTFWDYTLKKDIVLFSEGNRNGLGMRKSIQNMRQRYLKKGFLDAKITAQQEYDADPASNELKVRFMISEGVRTKVSQVTVKGNHAVPEEEIREQVLTQMPGWFHSGAFVTETLDEDIFAINTLYLNKGFQDAKVDFQKHFSPDRGTVAVDISIKEGPLTRVGKVSITGAEGLLADSARSGLQVQTDQPFSANLLQTDEAYLSSLVSEKGYPYVMVTSKSALNPDRTVADVDYKIDPGQQVRMGQVFVSGNLKTREKIVLRELEVAPEEPFSLQKLTDGQRALRNLDIFQSVQFKPIGLMEKQESVNLFVEVQEKKPYYTEVAVGYESDEGVLGRVELGDRNFLGLNKNISSSAAFSEIGYRLDVGILEPRLFGSKVSAKVDLYNEREKDFNTDTIGSSLVFGREWSDTLNTSLSFELKKVDQLDNPESNPVDDPRTVLVTTPAIQYDSRDSFIKPTRGAVSLFSVDISKRIENIDKSIDDFLRYNLDLRYYYTPIEKITLAWLGRLGHIQPFGGSDSVPNEELFYLGGISDVRGFEKKMLRNDGIGNEVGGRTALVGSFEIRFDIGWNLDFTIFFDTGSVRDAIRDKGSDEFRHTAGLGLRYMTAIGPIGLLYGRKFETRDGETPGRWHFSIGYTF